MKIYSLVKIETPRLIIRPVQLGDAIPLNKSLNNSLSLLQKWQPWAQDPSLKTTQDFIQRGVFAWDSHWVEDFPMVVIHKAEKKIIGASGYNDRSSPSQGLYEIGYWLDIDYQGQGLVTEYVNALTRYALEALDAKTVLIYMKIDNIKSANVAKRLNFNCDGIKTGITQEGSKDYRFACHDLSVLPKLELRWFSKSSHDPKIISWARSSIGIDDDKIFNQSKTLVKTPWSTVLEINTGKDPVYLKQTPKNLFLEAAIIKFMRNNCNATAIPNIIAENKELHCFLMTRCGDISLRHYFDGKLQLAIFKQGLTVYKKLQRSTAKHVDEFIALGVPDWRLDKFPELYQQLIASTQWIKDNGLTKEQQDKLHQYAGDVANLCQQLTTYAIPECLNHSDFHDNNILYDIKNQSTTIIDLGETAIEHPFFSLMACLNNTKQRYSLSENSEDYNALKQTCFSGWLTSDHDLQAALRIIDILLPLSLLFSHLRFAHATCPIELGKIPKMNDRVYKAFAWFIENMESKLT